MEALLSTPDIIEFFKVICFSHFLLIFAFGFSNSIQNV